MENKYAMLFYYSEDSKAWIVAFPELPGCMTHGETLEEALEMAKDVSKSWLDVCFEANNSVPGRKINYETTKDFLIKSDTLTDIKVEGGE